VIDATIASRPVHVLRFDPADFYDLDRQDDLARLSSAVASSVYRVSPRAAAAHP
jgi:hypothetical protein